MNKCNNDSFLPFYQDIEPCLGASPTVFSISLGDTANLILKNKSNEEMNVTLHPGSLLVFQQTYHSVSKPTNKKVRVNLTFRHIYKQRNTENQVLQEIADLKQTLHEMETKLANKDIEIAKLTEEIKHLKSSDKRVTAPLNLKQ